MPTHPRRRLALALTIGVALVLGTTAAPASAKPGDPKPPAYLLDGGDRWFTHDSGFPVVLGPTEVILHGRRTVVGELSATIHPDDYSMPAPGDCETALAFVHVNGTGRPADAMLSSAGEICGLYVGPGNVVTHRFVGTATFEKSGKPKLVGQEAFLEIVLAQDGRGGVFITTW
jgi:hypothetical protein